MTTAEGIERAAALLRQSQYAVAFTGAGISTPSGIPDFQSQNSGLWQRFDPMEVASITAFQSKPEVFYGWLRPLLRDTWNVQPNPAHVALAELERAGILKALITQNIDDLHQRAGSQKIYEVHGSVRTMTCPRCHENYPSTTFRTALVESEEMPRCPRCARVLKPDIVLYGEMLPQEVWQEAEAHCRRADVMLVVGSSLTVWPAAALPETALLNGAHLIINNRTATPLDPHAEVLLPLDVAEALPQIVNRIRSV